MRKVSACAGPGNRCAQGRMQGDLGFGELVAFDHELHVGLSGRLGHGQDVDAVIGQGACGLGQNAGLADIGTDGADDGHFLQGDLFEPVLQFGDHLRAAVTVAYDHADGVGVGGLADVGNTVFGQHLQNAQVKAHLADHARVMHFQAGDFVGAGHDFDHGFGRDEVLGDQCSGVVRVEGVLDPDGDVVDLQGLRCLGVNGLHAHVGQLVGHVEVGAADRMDVLLADDQRVAGAKMVFLVDDGFRGTQEDRDLGKGHFRIAPVELAHDALCAFGVARGETDGREGVDAFEAVLDAFVDGQLSAVFPAAQINKSGVVPAILQDVGGVEGAVHLAQRGQQLPRGQQQGRTGDIARGQDVIHAAQDVDGQVDVIFDEFVGDVQVKSGGHEGLVQLEQAFAQGQHFFGIIFLLPEKLINSGLAGFLVFQEFVGNPAVGGYDVDPSKNVGRVAKDHIIDDLRKPGHGCSADFFNTQLSFHGLSRTDVIDVRWRPGAASPIAIEGYFLKRCSVNTGMQENRFSKTSRRVFLPSLRNPSRAV